MTRGGIRRGTSTPTSQTLGAGSHSRANIQPKGVPTTTRIARERPLAAIEVSSGPRAPGVPSALARLAGEILVRSTAKGARSAAQRITAAPVPAAE